MNSRRSFALLASLALFALPCAPLARAVVGPARDGAAFADQLVMVLTRGAEGAGFCTGIVLAPRIVLTAAHCLRRTSDMIVHYRDPDGRAVLVAVAATAAHPLYRADAVKRRVVSIDVGLIETATPLPARFRPAALAAGEPPAVGDPAIVVGYGIGREGEAKSGGALRAADLKVRAPTSGSYYGPPTPPRREPAAVRATRADRSTRPTARASSPSSPGPPDSKATNAARSPKARCWRRCAHGSRRSVHDGREHEATATIPRTRDRVAVVKWQLHGGKVSSAAVFDRSADPCRAAVTELSSGEFIQ